METLSPEARERMDKWVDAFRFAREKWDQYRREMNAVLPPECHAPAWNELPFEHQAELVEAAAQLLQEEYSNT